MRVAPYPLPIASRGVALLFALAALALVAMLATVFASIAQMERSVAAASIDRLRARLLARGGVEAAVLALRSLSAKSIHEDPREMVLSPNGTWLRTFRGRLAATYGGGSDTYEVEARDAGGGLPLDSDHPFLGTMLDNLGRAIAAMRSDRLDPVRGRGARIVDLRRSLGRFHSRQQLLALLSASDFEVLGPHLSLGAWVDPTTVAPIPGRQMDPVAPFRREPRPPVDLNTASVPVLCAILCGVDSTLCEPVAFDAALRIAQEIDRVRRSDAPGEGPFHSLPWLDRFLRRLTAPPTAWLSMEQAATLMVNLDPNLHLTRLNPDRVIALGVDKTRLTYYTFEAAFRSMGRYEVASVGRIRAPDGTIVAEARATAIAEVYGVLRKTLQTEFEDGRESGPDAGTCTCPEAAGSTPADWAGHVQLHPSGGTAATLRFEAVFENSFLPGVGDPPLLAPPSAGLLERGRLAGDGLNVRRQDQEPLVFAASPHLPVEEGTIELWFKLNDSPTRDKEAVWFSSQPVGDGAHLQHEISLGRDRKRLLVRSHRILAEAREGAGNISANLPYEYRESELLAELEGPGVSNEWHHLSISWRDATRQAAFIDGRASGREVRLGAWGAPPRRPIGPIGDSLWIGVVPDGLDQGRGMFPRSGSDVTIDDVRVFSTPDLRDLAGFPPPDRFTRVRSPIVGRFAGGFDGLPFTAILDTIAWTAWIPSEFEGNRLGDGVAHVRFGLLEPGEDASLGHDPASCPVCQGSGHYGGSHDNATCVICLGLHNPEGSGPVPPDDPAAEQAEADGALVEDEIGRLGLPRVLVSRREIRYRLDFMSPRYLTPTNVTPVVDDLTLTYRGPIRFHSWFED